MKFDLEEEEELILTCVDQQNIKQKKRPRLNIYPIIEIPDADLNSIFQDPSEEQSLLISSQHPKSSHPLNMEVQKVSSNKKRQEVSLKVFEEVPSISKLDLKNSEQEEKLQASKKSSVRLKRLEIILLNESDSKLIGIFLKSIYFLNFIRAIIILNIVGVICTDYSFRLQNPSSQLSQRDLTIFNIISLNLQLFANCVFTIEIFLKHYYEKMSVWQFFEMVNLLGTAITWSTIFLDVIENDSSLVWKLCVLVRIVRALVRLIQTWDFLRVPFEVFISTIPSLYKVFFPLFIVILFYSMLGVTLFHQASHYRCLSTLPNSTSNHTPQPIQFCGSAYYSCPNATVCTKVQSIDLASDVQKNQINFENMGNAMLTVYHFIFLSNWTQIRTRFSYFINPYVSSLFFISMYLFLFLIFSNLVMISMSKAYLEEFKIREETNSKDLIAVQVQSNTQIQNIQVQINPKSLKLVWLFKILNKSLIIVHTIFLSIFFSGMEESLANLMLLIDLILSGISILIIIVLIIMQKKAYFVNGLNWIDVVTMSCHIVDLIICWATGSSVVYGSLDSSIILRNVKIIRIVKLFYMSEHFFAYEKYIISIFLKTLYKVKNFLLLCVCFLFMFKSIGELLFAYHIRSKGNASQPYIVNFQSQLKGIFAILYLFYNERWSITMQSYYLATGQEAILFFCIAVFVCHLMLIRLNIAVFLCYFKEELKFKSKFEYLKSQTTLQTEVITAEHQKQSELKTLKQEEMRHQFQKDQNHSEESKPASEESKPASEESKPASDEEVNQKEMLFWCIPKDCFIINFLEMVRISDAFYWLMMFTIVAHCLAILISAKGDSVEKSKSIEIITLICFTIYIGEVLVGFLTMGIYFQKDAYLKDTTSNKINFIVLIFISLSFMPFFNPLIQNYFKHLTIIKLFTIFRRSDKEMTIVLDTVSQIAKKFIGFLIIYCFLLLIISLIPAKLLYQKQIFYSCKLLISEDLEILNGEQCLQAGGVWVKDTQELANIISSIGLMYELISSESWSERVQNLFQGDSVNGFEAFFIVTFLIYNICFLNVFLGFIVETYLHLKDKAYNLNLLRPSQRSWILIKNSINCLRLTPELEFPASGSFLRRQTFSMFTSVQLSNFMDYAAYANATLYMLTSSTATPTFASTLDLLKNFFIALFFLETTFKVFAFRTAFFIQDNSHFELSASILTIIYVTWKAFSSLSIEQENIFKCLLALCMLMRCKKLLFRYSWSKSHINSVMKIFPKCGKIMKLMVVVLLVYVGLGMKIFQYTSVTSSNSYLIGFSSFLPAFLTLVKVASAQAWFEEVSTFARSSSTDSSCFAINSMQDALDHSDSGCGNWMAYPYFLSFHIIYVLLLINLLVATMASAYDENYQIEDNSVNIFQLQDCLSLWRKYDPKGQGIVHYKHFWKLASEIAILFGISKKKLIKQKQKFFHELNLAIYYSMEKAETPILSYRFHDVITQFSKIKLHMANTFNQKSIHQLKSQPQMDFQISPSTETRIRDYVTPFPIHIYSTYHPFKHYRSGQTKNIFALLKKLRNWRHATTSTKNNLKEGNLSNIMITKRTNSKFLEKYYEEWSNKHLDESNEESDENLKKNNKQK